MATRTRRWTRADVDRLPNDGNRYEVVDGELFVSPPPSTRHERVLHDLGVKLMVFCEKAGVGDAMHGHPAVVFGESYVEPDLIVSPRITPVPDTWDAMPRPFLIVEVISPASARRDRMTKRTLYARHGIPEYWVVDPEARTITVIRQDQPERVVSDRLSWRPEHSSKDFELDVQALFERALGPSERSGGVSS